MENLFPGRELVTATVFFILTNVFAQCINGVAQLNILGDQGFLAVCLVVFLPLLYVVICY